jgi:multisubunit Na+/H+ antiporter MnhB subunit
VSENKTSLYIGIVVSALIFGALALVLVNDPFPSSKLVHSELIPTQPGSQIGGAMSGFLWDFRGLDLLFQTLILFTTAICCLALLREEIRK